MQVTILHPAINLNERGVPQFPPLGEATGTTPPAVGKAPPRSPGMHVSALVKSIAVKLNLLKGQKAMGGKWTADAPIDEESFPLQMALGLAWEDWLSLQYPEMIYHPGELVMDGVAGSPDGITPLPDTVEYEGLGDAVVDEIKLTFKSGRNDDLNHPKNKIWLWQVMAYCKMLGVLCARLHVLYLYGNYEYSAPFPPCIYRIYCIQFTQQEVDMNWSMLLQEKASMEAACAS